MERGQNIIDIATLLSSGHGEVREQELSCIFSPETVEEHAWKKYFTQRRGKACDTASKKKLHLVENAIWGEWSHKRTERQSSYESPSLKVQDDHVVRGRDIGDTPTQYVVKGLQQHELPVIGTYVDKRIVPGWQYYVRSLGGGERFFSGKALYLQSIGMGYGKRLTFQSEKYNKNNNYFWSDSQPMGYGFTLEVMHSGSKFDVYDEDERQIGTAYIEAVDPVQVELSSSIDATGSFTKNVAVTFQCMVCYGADPHGVLSLFSKQELQLTGVAVSKRAQQAHRANLMVIKVSLPNFGPCLFFPEEE